MYEKYVKNTLLILNLEMQDLMAGLHLAIDVGDYYEMSKLLKRRDELQKLIDYYLKEHLKHNIYMTHFGQIVYSEEELNYWNELYNEIIENMNIDNIQETGPKHKMRYTHYVDL